MKLVLHIEFDLDPLINFLAKRMFKVTVSEDKITLKLTLLGKLILRLL